jgi:LysR family transcriptional regulator (chromosome initiation inhibitor)
MDVDLAQLRALSATASEGTLDAAARVLHVTPSAVSQRLRALEAATGRVLLVRSRPVQLTPSGRTLLRLARQLELLTAEAAAELGAEPGRPGTEDGGEAAREAPRPVLPLAVNADSLATWVLPALAPLAPACGFDLHREDEAHTSTLLRDGTVMAAVTTQADPVPGCRATRLGVMRYRPLAAPVFAERWFPRGVTAAALAVAPVVVFDRKDDLQHRYLRRRARRALDPPVHHVPSSADFLTAIRLGFGWGLLPDLQSGPDEAAGRLVDVDPRGATDVVLHWQQWRLRSRSLDTVAEAVTAAARAALLP